jgi:hypothetical protein
VTIAARLARLERSAPTGASARAQAWADDPVAFAREALGFEPDDWQQRALRWSGRRLILLCARQTGKSSTSAVMALHQAMFHPASLTLLISPSLRQSAELFRKVTEFLHQLEERPPLIEDNKLSLTMSNGSRVVSLPSSESTVRRFSAVDLLIEDEAARVSDDLHRATRPFLATSNGRHVLMSTPFGRRGHLFEAWENGGPAWDRIKVRAEDCARIPREFLDDERRALGALWYASEYEVAFTDTIDSVFRSADIEAALADELLPLFAEDSRAS